MLYGTSLDTIVPVSSTDVFFAVKDVGEEARVGNTGKLTREIPQEIDGFADLLIC